MKAIILAASRGNRLRPYTDNLPKCMVEIAGKPIIYHQLKTLAEVGVKEVTVVGVYQSDKITGDFHLVQKFNAVLKSHSYASCFNRTATSLVIQTGLKSPLVQHI